MSGLLGSILATTNSLKANQVAIETAGKNMANVNSTNYSRQRVEFGISGGISESTITQQRDAIIDDKIVRETSVTGSLSAQNKIYKQLQVIFGEQITGDVASPDTLEGSNPGDNLNPGLSTALDDFFNSLHSLSTNPNDVPTKAAVIAQAEVLVNRMNTLSRDFENLDEDVIRNVEENVVEVNSILTEIASMNKEISKIELSRPGGALEFRDLRQQKLEELAQYINFETREDDSGQLTVFAMDKSAGGGIEVILVEKTSVRNEIRFNEASNEVYFSNYTTSPLGNSPNSTAMDIEGGSLHGLIFVRSETDPHGGAGSQAIGPLAKIREDLDTLAVQLATEVSTIYDTPGDNEFFFDDDENPDAIDLSAITAGNIRLYPGDPLGDFGPVITPLNSTTLKATNTTNTGANEVALALAELRDNISSNLRGNTFGEFISEMATDLGYEVSSTENLLENQSLLNSQLQDQRASVSGVSIDEELANIIRFQKSFEASARVLQVMDEMLEVIVSLAR